MDSPAPAFKQLDHLIARVEGPRRLFGVDENSIQALVLEVSSLARAETFLRESGMLGSVGEDHVKIDPSKVEGLDVRLVQ